MRMLFLILSLLSVPLLNAQDNSTTQKPIIFILDASGSMWGKIDAATKIELARKVLQDLVGQFPDEQAIGLVAYGHRKKGDCNDVEYILPPAQNNKSAFISQMAQIKPLGKTPLAISARLVIDQLRKEQAAARIILISDGIETCSGDLCQLVNEAKAEGIDFVLHIIGFDLADTEKSALQCAAEASDGQYLDAKDGQQLADALQSVSEVPEELPISLSLLCTKGDELYDMDLRIVSQKRSAYVKSARSYDQPDKNPAQIALPPGTYTIRGKSANSNGIDQVLLKDVVIKEGQITKDTIHFNLGRLSLLCQKNGAKVDAKVEIYKEGFKEALVLKRSYTGPRSNPVNIELEPGKYKVKAKLIGTKSKQVVELNDVVIQSDQDYVDTLNFSTGKIAVQATANGVLYDVTVNIKNTNTGKNLPGGRTYESEKTNPRINEVQPGTYEVQLKSLKIKGLELTKTFSDVVVEPEKVTELAHNFESATLKVKTMHQGQLCGATVNIYSVQQAKKSVANSRLYLSPEKNPRSFLLMPDTYKVVVNPIKVDGASKKTFTVTLKAQETIEKVLEF